MTSSSRVMAGAFLAVALTGCASAPLLKKTIKIDFVATKDLNSATADRGFKLNYRIVQTSEVPSLEGAQVPTFWNKEKDLLGSAWLEQQDGSLQPGTTREESVPRNPRARAFIVVGNFYRPNTDCWYVIQPLKKGSSIKLTAGSSCFTETKK